MGHECDTLMCEIWTLVELEDHVTLTEVSGAVWRPLTHQTLLPDMRTEAETLQGSCLDGTQMTETLPFICKALQTFNDLLIPSLEQLICAASRCMQSSSGPMWKHTCDEYSSET